MNGGRHGATGDPVDGTGLLSPIIGGGLTGKLKSHEKSEVFELRAEPPGLSLVRLWRVDGNNT